MSDTPPPARCLPRIAPYPLPTAGELPPARGPWAADPARLAILVHDMQNYFCGPFTPGESPLTPAITNIARLVTAARAMGIPVFYTAQEGNQDRRDRGLQADLWGPGMRTNPEHQAIVPQLTPDPRDFVLVKHRYSAFQRSNLQTLMRARGRDQLAITGIYAHIGCMMTAAEAFQRDIEAFFIADALADFSRAEHDMALKWVAGRCGVPMMTETLLERIGIPMSHDLETLRADIAAALHLPADEIGDEDNLMDLGLDSMRVMHLLLKWESEGMKVDFANLAEHATLAGWWQVIGGGQG